jgi:hypothetical protein
MALRLIASCATFLCLTGAAVADDIIYKGLHCNSFCQQWMGISPDHAQRKRRCPDIVSHPADYNDDLVQLCKFVSGRPPRQGATQFNGPGQPDAGGGDDPAQEHRKSRAKFSARNPA